MNLRKRRASAILCNDFLESQKNGRWYIGHTANLEERLTIHNSGKVISSAPHAPYGVMHKEEFATKSEAAKRERQIKRSGIIRKAIKNRIKRERLNLIQAPSSNG